jgi:hypothetical protein
MVAQHNCAHPAERIPVDHLEALRHLLSLLPLQVFAGGIIPVLQFAREKFRSVQSEQRKLHLRSKLVAVVTFISSLHEVTEGQEWRAVCLNDAIKERDDLLSELAASIARETARNKQPHSKNWLPWLFLLYQPPHPVGWVFRWSFFALLFVTVGGSVRGLLHENLLPIPVLVPFLMTSLVLAVVVRLVAARTEGVYPRRLRL